MANPATIREKMVGQIFHALTELAGDLARRVAHAKSPARRLKWDTVVEVFAERVVDGLVGALA